VTNHTLSVNATINGMAKNADGRIDIRLINTKTQKAMVGIISEALEIVSSDPSIKLKTSSISLL
jgi:hypothetical protein